MSLESLFGVELRKEKFELNENTIEDRLGIAYVPDESPCVIRAYCFCTLPLQDFVVSVLHSLDMHEKSVTLALIRVTVYNGEQRNN